MRCKDGKVYVQIKEEKSEEVEIRALKEGKAEFKRQMEERAENEAQAEVSVIRASPWFVSRRLRDFQFPKETRKQIASNARHSDWLSLQLSWRSTSLHVCGH
jgi:hypothetical protein